MVIKKIGLALLLFFVALISCYGQKTIELEIGRLHAEKIQIYVRKDTLKFGDSNFKDEINISYMKIDLNKNTISSASEKQHVGDLKSSKDLVKLFKDSDFSSFIITTKNAFEIPKVVLKYKRKWNDFATPGRSVTPAEKFVTEGNTIKYKKSRSLKRFVFDSELSQKANEN